MAKLDRYQLLDQRDKCYRAFRNQDLPMDLRMKAKRAGDKADAVLGMMDAKAKLQKESGAGAAKRIEAIEKMMRTDRRGYDKDEKIQAEYRQLIEARDKAASS